MRTRAIFVLLLMVPALIGTLAPSPTPDWPSWYAGAKLAGTDSLYSLAALHAETAKFADPGTGWSFVRLPIYATMLRPLAWFEPQTAYWIWQCAMLAATIGAVALLWPSPAAAAIALFGPLSSSFRQGQDMPLLLLAFAATLVLLKQDRHVLAGSALGFLLLKPHLFLLVALAILLRRQFRLGLGVCISAGALIAGSFLVGGIGWPAAYIAHVSFNEAHIHPSSIVSMQHPALSAVWVLIVTSACYAVCQRTSVAGSLAGAWALGILIAPRWFTYDMVVLLPAAILLLKHASEGVVPASTPAARCGAIVRDEA